VASTHVKNALKWRGLGHQLLRVLFRTVRIHNRNKIIHYKYLCVLRGEIQGDYNSTEKKIGSARQKKYIKITSFSKSGIDKFSTMNETEIL